MRLVVAEKPSLARAIAAAIPGPHRRSQHHIECATGDIVAWCAGHVLEMAPPEDYSAALATWALDTLPVIPRQWRHRIAAPELVASLRRLLARAERVVHAGDPDREGQLLVDEVLLHLGWRGPTERLLVTDLSPAAIARALEALEPNERYHPLYESALARQRADWLYGLNLTRLYTLRGRLAGYRGVVSVGRVQTPVLGLIVRRDREIEAFVPKPFYGVTVTLRSAAGAEFEATWAVGKDEHGDKLDAEGRLLDRELARTVASRVAGTLGCVADHEATERSEQPPLPHSLASLQVEAGRQLGLSAARTLELAQRLYERQLVTYPRSDCAYLPAAQRGQARGVLDAVREHAPMLVEACGAADLHRCGRVWDDSRVTAHHAIVPTANTAAVCGLDATDRSLYELVARRYVQQFLPPFEYLQTRAEIRLANEIFVARGRRTLALGWRAFEPVASTSDTAEKGDDDAAEDTALPPLDVGDRLLCRSGRLVEKRTQPPKPFTDATLIQAMCNIGRFLADPKARKVLADTDGIGTPATRASIIERLFDREYVERRTGKQIRSTAVGRALIDALPPTATTPDMTAAWELGLRLINDRQLGLERFLGAIGDQLAELVARGKAAGPLVLPQVLQTTAAPRKASKRAGRLQKAARRPRRAAAPVGKVERS